MAYTTKHRDPLFDSAMQEAIEKRGKELLGMVLVALGVALAAILWTYVPDDPSWLSATDQPAQNALGKFGATLAAPMYIVVGLGAWGLAFAAIGWGLRYILHLVDVSPLWRVVAVPFAAVLGSVYASTLGPSAAFSHTGLGGLFGDLVLGMLVNILPVGPTFGVRVLAFPLALATFAMGAYALGVTHGELRQGQRFLLLGIVVTYAHLVRLGATIVQWLVDAVSALADRSRQRETDEPEMPDFGDPEPERRVERPVFTSEQEELEPAQRPGLLAHVTSFVKRPPAESLPADPMEMALAGMEPEDVPTEDRIKARITDAIRLRARKGHATAARKEPPVIRMEPPVRKPAKPEPLVVKTAGAVRPAPMAELDTEDDAEAPAAFTVPELEPQADELRPSMVQHATRRAAPSRKARAEAQPSLFDGEAKDDAFELPPLSLLENPVAVERHHLSDEALEENARMLETVLDDYGVKGEIVSVRPGPVVTMYELEPAPGLKASRVIGLADDIARSMSALSARVSTVPGRSVIGIELPNASREKVVLREILSARTFGDANMRLPLALGKDIGGDPVVANLAKMPHLLIAGTTGSGKSVAINTMILSLLYRLTPDECRLIMIDPKMLELSVYDGIPHLLSPVVTDPKKAVVALKWVVGEMEDRYRKMSKMGVRNIEGYNGRVRDALSKGEMFSRTVQTGFDDETGEPVFETEEFAPELLPFIVVIVDEMADLMMVAGKEIEACIQRLAQMARASGIHLIMATQRPSVDVITGTIKANFPTRISFQVTSKVDSRTILGEMGAEQLLGMGDMLYMAGGGKITRCHGPFVSDEEVEEIVKHLKSFGPPDYVGGVVEGPEDDKEAGIDAVLGLTGGNTDGEDALYDQAVQIVIQDRKCSTSYIQRKLAIGYNKAARLVEQMEENGLVSPSNHVGKREVLVPEQA